MDNRSVTAMAHISIMLGMALGLASSAMAMQNEPSDFQGIAWGTPLEKLRPELKVITEDGDAAHFRRPSDRPFYAGIEVRRISYYFYQGTFSSGTFLTVGTNDFKTIVAHLTQRFGEPKTVNARHRVYAWEGERTGITLSCDITISCYTEIYDRALRLKELAQAKPTTATDND